MFRSLAARLVTLCRNIAFDFKYNVETRSSVNLRGLKIASTNLEHGTPYVPTHPKSARLVFERLPITDFSKYVFVDFGSGKGRMLFHAAEYPFQQIIGVEFSPELHAIAQRNIRTYRNARQVCFDIRSVNVDAADFPFPSGDTVMYFFFPFRRPVMEPLIARLDQSIDNHPRDVVLCYMNPELDFLIDAMRTMKLHTKERYFSIYRSKLSGAVAPAQRGQQQTS